MTSDILNKLQNIVDYHFDDVHYLERALTHSSTKEDYNYQRLEFLGDRVLGLVMADILFCEFRGENEGGLAKRHTVLVQGTTCSLVGKQHNIADYIILSRSEREAGVHLNENIIADVVEALIGAVYIDGGYEPAKKVVLKLWGDNVNTLEEVPQDPKTELQEWVQARGYDLPSYDIIDKSGPDHAPLFSIQLSVTGQKSIVSKGNSRRLSEKEAARLMLEQIKSSN